MRKVIAIVGALVLVLAAAGTSHAVLLSDLLGGGSMTVGDKLFDNWSLTYYDSSDPARSFNAANIDVTGISDALNPGLNFAVSNNELSVTGDDIYAYVDLMFGFRVAVTDPNYRIKDNSLALNSGSILLSGDNGFYVRETIGTAPSTANLGAKNVEFSYLDGTGLIEKLSDSASFAPQSEIWVTKNILVWATGSNETANLWGFDQHFSQVPVGMPEPGMLSLLALGGIALLRFKRS